MSESNIGHTPEYRNWIIEAIQEYPLIQHKQLLDYLDKHKQHHMAKRTVEKYLKELINEEKIFVYTKGKKIKKYDLPSAFGLTEKLQKKQFDKWISEIKKSLAKMEKDYENYNIYMKVNSPDSLKQLYRSLQSFHNAYENQDEDYSYEDLGTRENILYCEIIKATDGTPFTDNSIMQQRNDARKINDEIRRLKEEDHRIYKKLKRGIKKPSERENLKAVSNKIGKEITTAFTALEKIHDSLVSNANYDDQID